MDNINNNGFHNFMKWAFADIQGSSALSLDRNRPYDGQPHTTNGERGKQEVKGLTMRDISDCIVLGFLNAGGIYRECPIHDDLYSLDLNDIDLGAAIQNAMCWIEKYMSIYPNVPELKENKERGEK